MLSFDVTVTGNAPVSHANIAPYRLKSHPDAFKSYPIVKESLKEQIVRGKLVSTQKYRMRLLALKPGRWRLDPFEFVYFDPHLHQYQTASTQPFEISVSENGVIPEADDSSITPETLDDAQIVPIQLKRAKLRNPPSFLWMLIGPLMLCLIVMTHYFRSMQNKIKREKEEKEAYLKRLEKLSTASSSDEQHALIRELLSMRYHVDIGRSTDDLGPKLSGIFTDQQSKVIIQVLNELRMTSYSTQTPLECEKLRGILEILKTTQYMEPKS